MNSVVDCEPFMLTFKAMAHLRQPIVYVWSRGEEILYVGMSMNGMERPLSKAHDHLNRFQPGDLLTIWPSDQAVALEAAFIYHLRPRLNRARATQCPICQRSLDDCSGLCRNPDHAPDSSFFWPVVRSNVDGRDEPCNVRGVRPSSPPNTLEGDSVGRPAGWPPGTRQGNRNWHRSRRISKERWRRSGNFAKGVGSRRVTKRYDRRRVRILVKRVWLLKLRAAMRKMIKELYQAKAEIERALGGA